MDATELTKKLQTLAIKRDVWPSSIDESTLGAMLFDAARSLPDDRDLSEREATDELSNWLQGSGSSLRFDAVELRRQLVDWQFIKRDGFGRAYRRCAAPPARFADVCAIAATLAFAPLIADARSRDAEIRAARKAAHLAASNAATN